MQFMSNVLAELPTSQSISPPDEDNHQLLPSDQSTDNAAPKRKQKSTSEDFGITKLLEGTSQTCDDPDRYQWHMNGKKNIDQDYRVYY